MLIPLIAWLWHNIALNWGNFLPLPGTKWSVVRKFSGGLPSPFGICFPAIGCVVLLVKNLTLNFTLHPYKHLAIRCLCLIGEGWRVFLKVAFYPPPAESSIQSSQLRVQRYEIFSMILHYRHRNLLVRPLLALFVRRVDSLFYNYRWRAWSTNKIWDTYFFWSFFDNSA